MEANEIEFYGYMCVCVNFCTCALIQLSPIGSDNIRHGMGRGKPRKGQGRVTTASTDLQNDFLEV